MCRYCNSKFFELKTTQRATDNDGHGPPMNPTTRRCLPHITDPGSRSESVWNSYERRINYSAPSSLVFMPIHISCSSAQNNVKLRYADVGNWWPRQQTQPQTAFYKLIGGLISAGGGEYMVQWLSLSSIWCVDISCVQLKNNNKLPHTEERSWRVLSAPQRNKQHISAI